MELHTDTTRMLDLVTAPVFCVKENIIVSANAAAQGLFFRVGSDVRDLIQTGADDYARFHQGCLYLSVKSEGSTYHACVTRENGSDIFLLEPVSGQPELQALALAAKELRTPLNSAMLVADQLLRDGNQQQEEAHARLNRGLYQLLRIVENMSDAEYWYAGAVQELCDICAVLEEILSKAQTKVSTGGIAVTYSLPQEQIYTHCSPAQLERAVLNLISNAVKFTPKDGQIEISLTCQGNCLQLRVQNTGSAIADEVLQTIFSRYRRQPMIEDSRHGIGLGMVLVRNAAMDHGGTVLVDRPDGNTTRITMTLAIRTAENCLRTPVTLPHSGGYDPGLIQLSEVLPYSLYNGKQ